MGALKEDEELDASVISKTQSAESTGSDASGVKEANISKSTLARKATEPESCILPVSERPFKPATADGSAKAPLKVIFITHGSVEEELETDIKIHTTWPMSDPWGTRDPPLTDKGETQATELQKDSLIKGCRRPLVVVSPLRCALKTAALACGSNLCHLAKSEIQEFTFLPCNVDTHRRDLAKEFPSVDFSELDDAGVEKEQPKHDDTPNRVKRFKIWLSERDEDEIIVVSHQLVIRLLTGVWLANCDVLALTLDRKTLAFNPLEYDRGDTDTLRWTAAEGTVAGMRSLMVGSNRDERLRRDLGHGWPMLFWAAYIGEFKTMRLLLEYGADPTPAIARLEWTEADKLQMVGLTDARTVLDWAKDRQRTDVIGVLKEHHENSHSKSNAKRHLSAQDDGNGCSPPLKRLKPVGDCAPQGSSWVYPLRDEKRRCFAGHLPGALPKDLARDFFDIVDNGTWWTRSGPLWTAWMVKQPCSCVYGYTSGVAAVQPSKWPSWMDGLLQHVMPLCGITAEGWPNSCNINRYDDGWDGVGWHADDEPLFQGFVAGTDNWKEQEHNMLLADGDLLTMEGMTQKHYRHAVLRTEDEDLSPRLNLTWRWILQHGVACALSERQLMPGIKTLDWNCLNMRKTAAVFPELL